MNISGCAPRFPNASHCLPMYPVAEPVGSGSSLDQSHSSSILCNLSILKDKVHEVQSLVSILISPGQAHLESTSLAIASMGSLVQDIIQTASSMLFVCQQMSLGATSGNNIGTVNIPDNRVCQPPNFGENCVGNINIVQDKKGQSFYSSSGTISWYGDRKEPVELPRKSEISEGSTQPISSAKNYDIIELDAADLLAKYTHYCQVCGKGFKRDANLKMHMRAHGDEYKSIAALINPMKNVHHTAVAGNGSTKTGDQKYSCPQEGCRWNQKHAKFTPLKSMICVKNHYKRSHCPKMYVCKRCNRKQFSVLSDLRTHEKHCGNVKWQCSCGTTFSRKDKLMGHVALFVGHSPLVVTNSMAKPG